jgi:glutathione S-transferase
MSRIILYQFTLSPYCVKVRKILEYKGLSYTTVEVNPFTRAGVRRLSGQRRVPVLVEEAEAAADGRPGTERTVVADSTAIALHLEARHPDPPVYPRDPDERARVLTLEDWSDETFAGDLIPFKILTGDNAKRMVAQSVRYYPRTLPYRVLPPFGPLVLRRLASWRRRGRSLDRMRADYEGDLAHLDELARAGRFLAGGERPTVADFAVWGLLRTMQGMQGEELLARHASLAEWYERVETIEA